MLTPSLLTPMDGGTTTTFGFSVGSVIIAINTAVSPAFNCGYTTPFSVLIPATWTTATLAFQVSQDGTNFYPLWDYLGAAETISPSFANGTAVLYALNPAIFAGFCAFKAVSGSNASNVTQTAAVTLQFLFRNLN